MNRIATFNVLGMPAPQGSKGYKGMRNGRAVLAESSKKVGPWRREVVHAAMAARQVAEADRRFYPLDEAVVARMIFTLPKPASAPKRRTTYPSTTPDLSKLARSTEDALRDAGLLKDDARIVGYSRLWKVYPNEDPESLDTPGARIWVYPLVESAQADYHIRNMIARNRIVLGLPLT